MNAHHLNWESRIERPCTMGRIINNLCEEQNLLILNNPNIPTFIRTTYDEQDTPHIYTSVIDLITIRELDITNLEIINYENFYSDHYPIK
jgi:Endonuclease-reverse transcriptase